ncbi:hypothetical protein [Bradyrhizobium sp. S69]|uniref:hypothetical protein n=1 Tax=Bradyrhizobium sp. S69 TaxID=1641856 RepID=UPI00131C8D8A|nr:hypothetical protein [Bradyrhizobium sp. S69]
MPLDLDQRRFVSLGFKLFGDDWHGKFARMIDLSRPYVSMIAKGDRPVTDAVKAAVIKGLHAELRALRARGMAVSRFLLEYENS